MASRYKPGKTKKSLGALQVGWTSKSGKFVARFYKSYYENKVTGEIIGQGQSYGNIQIGNTYFKMTEREGNYFIEAYKQAVRKAKTKQEMEEVNKFFKQFASESPGKVGILLENISSNSGISELFKQRLSGKMPPGMSSKFDKLAKLLEEINKDRMKAQMFYDETKRAFTVVANKYKEMKEQGGTLDEFSMMELEESLDTLLNMAEQYAGEKQPHQMEITSYSTEGESITKQSPTLKGRRNTESKPKDKKIVKK